MIPSATKFSIGYNLRMLRQGKGLKQSDLALLAGPTWTQQRIAQIEAGKNIRIDTLDALVSALGCRVNDLVQASDMKRAESEVIAIRPSS